MKAFFQIVLLIALFNISAISQNSKYTYYEFGVLTKETPLYEILKETYHLEFYNNDKYTVYLEKNIDYTSLMYFNKNGEVEEVHLFKNEKYYKVLDYNYIDRNLNELSENEQEEIKKFFKVVLDTTLKINGFDCYIVYSYIPHTKRIGTKLYVTDNIPNLPNTLLPSNVSKGTAVKIEILMWTPNVEVGILKEEGVESIEDHLGVSFKNAEIIDQVTFEKLLKE